MQRNQLTVNLLRRLQRVGVGVNSVEVFAKKNSGEGVRVEKRRKRMIQLMMRAKLEDAELELKWSAVGGGGADHQIERSSCYFSSQLWER